jgi:hypothetical protein
MAASPLFKKAVAEAKRIRKKSPNTKWTSAMKQAFSKLKKKKPARKKTAKKKTARRTTARKKTSPRKRVSGVAAVGSVAFHKSAIRSGLKTRLGKIAGAREMAKGIRERKKMTKQIAKIKKDIRALC